MSTPSAAPGPIFSFWPLAPGVSTRGSAPARHWEHPHRDHRRKIERRDSGTHTQRLQARVRVDATPHRFRMIAFEQLGRACRELDDLDAALNRSHRVEKHLAVFLADERGDLFLMLLDELAKPVQDPRAPKRRRGPPC